MGVGGAQERMVELQRDLVLRAPIRPGALRVYLHPQGASRSAACARTLRSLRQMLATRTPVTYSELLDARA